MNRNRISTVACGLLLFATSLLHAQSTRPAPTTVPTTAQSNPITPSAKIELFNGKDLVGWTAFPKDETGTIWTIKDGVLVCTGRPNGYLRTEQAYKQFKLTVEWRFTRAGNSGVLVHITGPDKVWPMCIECQGAHLHQGDFWIWSGAAINEPMKQRNGVIMAGPSVEKELGEWNTYQVICKDDTVAILVNGKEMNKVTGANIAAGQVALQCEGGAYEVRKVTIEPLTP